MVIDRPDARADLALDAEVATLRLVGRLTRGELITSMSALARCGCSSRIDAKELTSEPEDLLGALHLVRPSLSGPARTLDIAHPSRGDRRNASEPQMR